MLSDKKQKITEILEEALDLTRKGKLQWKDTPREECFLAILDFGQMMVERHTSLNADGEEIVTLEISLLNSNGRVVETVNSASEISEEQPSLLPDLFRAARSNARQSDSFLEGFRNRLFGLERS